MMLWCRSNNIHWRLVRHMFKTNAQTHIHSHLHSTPIHQWMDGWMEKENLWTVNILYPVTRQNFNLIWLLMHNLIIIRSNRIRQVRNVFAIRLIVFNFAATAHQSSKKIYLWILDFLEYIVFIYRICLILLGRYLWSHI